MAPGLTTNGSTNGHTTTSSLKATAPAFSPTATPDASAYHASTTDEALHDEHEYAAHNYHPLPIVFARAQGCKVWDPEGREYLDFVSVNATSLSAGSNDSSSPHTVL